MSRIDIAKSLNAVHELEELVATSFGGGRHYRVADSRYYVVELQLLSGPIMREIYVFESVDDALLLRLVVPGKLMQERKIEVVEGRLVISVKASDAEEWEVLFEWIG